MSSKKKNYIDIEFDMSKTYMCPMVRLDDYEGKYPEIKEVHLETFDRGYKIVCNEEGYKEKLMYDRFLDWLFHTKWIYEKK